MHVNNWPESAWHSQSLLLNLFSEGRDSFYQVLFRWSSGISWVVLGYKVPEKSQEEVYLGMIHSKMPTSDFGEGTYFTFVIRYTPGPFTSPARSLSIFVLFIPDVIVQVLISADHMRLLGVGGDVILETWLIILDNRRLPFT